MITDEEYERRCQESENALRPKLTPEVLEVMCEAVRVCGWSVDFNESASFIRWCYKVAGVELPDDFDEEINPVGE